MNVGDTYDDEQGTWRVLSVTNAGLVRSAALMPGTETPEFEASRQQPPRDPDPEQAAINAFAAGDDTKQSDALRAMAKRMASA